MPTYVLCPSLNAMYSRTRRSTVSSELPASGLEGIDSRPAGLLRTMICVVFVEDVEGGAGPRLRGPIAIQIDADIGRTRRGRDPAEPGHRR